MCSRILLLSLLTILYYPAASQKALLEGFNNPPPSAKARTWWHWIDGNVTRHGITADLEAMQRVGIQEAQLFSVGQGFPEGPAKYMSAEWLDLVRFAASEAQRLGMELSFHNSAGWSSSGGPWVTPEYAMQTVVYSETHASGGARIHQQIPRPAIKFDYYRDIAVVAFPTPKTDRQIDQLALKTLSGDQFKVRLLPDDKIILPSAIIAKTAVIDLSSKLGADGTLDWAAPPGDWTIIRFGHTPNGTENHPAGSGGRGLEIDKMSRKAMDLHWTAGIQPVLDKLGPLAKEVLNSCLIDSYEVGCNNWTTGFGDEFRQRCKYDIIPFLPALAGYYVGSGEMTERFLWDFRKTIGDLIADNYYGYFAQLCHKAGIKFSVEPYGGPFDAITAGAKGDIVMGEFWLGSNSFSESAKLAASIAHITGGNIAGAESFTSEGGWYTHPALLKPTGDKMWTNGINRFIFHTYTHQPWDRQPGLTFQKYGLDMNRHNTWWEQSRGYMNYIARSQFLLQSGHSFADLLVFTGEGSPNDAMLRPDIRTLGYDYDQIGYDDLLKLTVKDGRLSTPNGLSYRLLILPDDKWATPQLLKKLSELANAGAVIVGPKPARSPGLTDYPANDQQVTSLANELWPSLIFTDTELKKVVKKLQLSPDLSAADQNAGIDYIHRVDGDNDIYFISNPKNIQVHEMISFRVTGKQPSLWDPATGKTTEMLVWQNLQDGRTRIPITMEANGSLFVVFHTPAVSVPNITGIKQEHHQRPTPLGHLKIMKAEYGTFLPEGMGDVTDALKRSLTTDSIRIAARNDLLPADPAPGSVKELRVNYILDGRLQQVSLVEGQELVIRFNGKKFRIIRALYGKFTQEFKTIPPKYPVYEETKKLIDLVGSNTLTFTVSDSLFGIQPAGKNIGRELRLTYEVDDEIQTTTVPKGDQVHLEKSQPAPAVVMEDGGPVVVTPYNGKVSYAGSKASAGAATRTIEIKDIPEPVVLSGAWDLSFMQRNANPIKTIFPELIPWSHSEDSSIRYFSGSAIYKKQFVVTPDMIGKDRSLELDLGNVQVIAEVFANGKELGTLWKAPFRIDLGDAVHQGTNDLEIRVTNLWVNRLIGDARLPDDLQWTDGPPASWPDWVFDTTVVRPSKRSTFATWRHWDAKAHLKPSGLIGPVLIRTYRHAKLY